ncbi:MAG: hypothetical protein Q7U74_11950 [Saprospiraceae bacterium]|nr:hypothetical protein [Saprospiraceae bacterium]
MHFFTLVANLDAVFPELSLEEKARIHAIFHPGEGFPAWFSKVLVKVAFYHHLRGDDPLYLALRLGLAQLLGDFCGHLAQV